MTVKEIREVYQGYLDGKIKFNANYYDIPKDVIDKTLSLMELVSCYSELKRDRDALNASIIFDKYLL